MEMESVKVLLAPSITFGMGLFGFITTTLARRKRFSNERISTLKDIQALPASISDDWSIKKRVEKEMRIAVISDLTGISQIEEAEKFIKITSLIPLTESQEKLLKKSLNSIYFSTRTIKKGSKPQHINRLHVKLDVHNLKSYAWFKVALLSILLIAFSITQFTTTNFSIQTMAPINIIAWVVVVVGSFSCGLLLSSFVWPWNVKRVGLMIHKINKNLRHKALKENEKIMHYIE